jgi:hypothetical protein
MDGFSFYSKYYLLAEKIHSSTDLLRSRHCSTMSVKAGKNFLRVLQTNQPHRYDRQADGRREP